MSFLTLVTSARSGSGSPQAPPLRKSLAGPLPAAKPWAPAVAAPCRLPAWSCTRGQSPILGGQHLQEEFQSARPIGDTSAPARARLASRLGEPPTPRPLLEAEGRVGPGDRAGCEAAPPPGRLCGVPHPGRSIPRRAPRPSVLTPVPVARADSGTRPSPGRGRARRRRAWSPRAAAQPALLLGRTVPGPPRRRAVAGATAPGCRRPRESVCAELQRSPGGSAASQAPATSPRPQERLPRAPAARRPRAEVSSIHESIAAPPPHMTFASGSTPDLHKAPQ
ncbi:uncharacterized protein LOC143441226 [Arvicanthis niloticus]|uniref:uncharacterized protein LOC143441226 n=1 Tax=Arvicanthis niloticus TaxID=61156 RepID=UPI00403CD3A8